MSLFPDYFAVLYCCVSFTVVYFSVVSVQLKYYVMVCTFLNWLFSDAMVVAWIGHKGRIYPTEIGKHFKSGLNLLFCWLSRPEIGKLFLFCKGSDGKNFSGFVGHIWLKAVQKQVTYADP